MVTRWLQGSTSLVYHTASSAVIIECFYKSSVSVYINGHFHLSNRLDVVSKVNLYSGKCASCCSFVTTDFFFITQLHLVSELLHLQHWKTKKKVQLSDMTIQRWFLRDIWPILWILQFYDSALWWWHLARGGRIRRTNQPTGIKSDHILSFWHGLQFVPYKMVLILPIGISDLVRFGN